MSRKKQIINLFLNNTYSKSVQEKFHRWFTSPSSEEEKDEALMQLWADLTVESDEESVEESYQKTLGKMKSTAKKKAKIPLFTYFSRAAIVVLLVATSLTAIHYYTQSNKLIEEQDVEFVECFVPSGQTQSVLLPDSTTVTMNSGTVLIYPKVFGKNTRNIYLNGEAVFSVKKDEAKPFIVKTKDMNIRVLGTVFNVSSYAENEYTATTLKSGSVSVSLSDDLSGFIVLTPNEQLVYNKHTKTSSVKNVDVDKVLAWQEGTLIFQDITINELTQMLERKYGIDIYMNTDKYQKERVTAKFEKVDNYKDVFEVLAQIIPDFNYKIEEKKIFIY